jgi:hypothetical protein
VHYSLTPLINNRINRLMSVVTERVAQSWSCSFVSICVFPDASPRSAKVAGASAVHGGEGGAHQEGSLFVIEAFTFAPVRLVQQRVRQVVRDCFFSSDAPVSKQLELNLLGRVDAPSIVPTSLLKTARTYREAVRLCWTLRRARGLRPIDLGRDFGFTRQHVTDYLHEDDAPSRRSLPPERICEFEEICGNVAITQWLASRSKLTLLEELQAERMAA